MDNPELEREHLELSTAALGIALETRTFKPLHKPTQLQPYHSITVNCMAEKENGLAKGGLLADDCGTGVVWP